VPITRREFLKGIGFVAGGAGLAAASYRHLIPFIHQPDDIVPGVSTWFATSCRECPAGCSMIVRNRDAHVVKCEGNPQSPLNVGKLCSRGQAALHGLYDPDRIAGPMRRGTSGKHGRVSWDEALRIVGGELAKRPRIAIISDLQTGSIAALMHSWLTAFGADRLLSYEPINYENVKTAFGGVVPSLNLAASDYLISFAADFLETWVSPVEYAKEFAIRRRIENGARGRFVYSGPRVSMTAANADLRLTAPPGSQETLAQAIMGTVSADDVAKRLNIDPADIRKIAADFAAAHAPLALPGLDADSARAAALLNAKAGSGLINRGRPHALTGTASRSDITSLISDMENGKIDLLIVHGANPLYALPNSAHFAQAMQRVPMVVSLSSFMDETTAKAHWILPSHTPLESWGDYTPYPDIRNIAQPTMGLLLDTRETGDILMQLAQAAGLNPVNTFKAADFYGYLRLRWGFPVAPGQGPEASAPGWENLVQVGGSWTAGTAAGPTAPPAISTPATSSAAPVSPPTEGELRLWAYPSIYFYDGRGANRRWLQEMPEPVTMGVWGTLAEMNPSTAKRLGISTDDVVEITHNGASIQAPAYVWEGMAADTIGISIGEGHTDYGRFAAGTGANVLALLDVDIPAVKVNRTGNSKWAARVKGSTEQYGREIVQTVALAEPFKRTTEIRMPLASGYGKNDFYPPHSYASHRWAMVVDLDKCIGCHACVTACYAENNLGIVGEDGFWRRREMSWIRIDNYTEWKDKAAPVLFQPMLCQHCDAAPCEPVCPVFASSHSDEGLNMQIYNRCVGTRYCSHNCPYKVRRFNWFDWKWPHPMQYQLNPDVTVRCRGVMEKCTFCIQRIREAEINALREARRVREGEITPACVQTCPTGVFTFGDLKDPNSQVSQLFNRDPRAYQVLGDLNTKPGIVYLKRIVDRA
jgi:molybdopterin-containing oxidoreductase family iron-sulfur binding subunit